jgi:PIN domain nuclease of toxin-antitoxin system
LVWLFYGESQKLSASARKAVDGGEPVASPASVLELQLLHEIGRMSQAPSMVISILESEIGLRVCGLPFREVVTHALKETWTRDPFDRLIVANAKAASAQLVTKDERILKHYRRAVW